MRDKKAKLSPWVDRQRNSEHYRVVVVPIPYLVWPEIVKRRLRYHLYFDARKSKEDNMWRHHADLPSPYYEQRTKKYATEWLQKLEGRWE